MSSAALRVDDPRISEAHALVSLRDGALHLLALRGALAVDRKRVTEVVLCPGQDVRLAKDCHLHVLDVHVPSTGLGLAIDDGPAELLIGGAASLITTPEVGLSHRFIPDAPAHVWSDGAGWRLGLPEGSVLLEPGAVHAVAGHTLHVHALQMAHAGLDATAMRGRVHAPLRVVARYDSVHLHREGQPMVVLSGVQARIFSELVAFDGPTEWEVVAREIWKETDRHTLRRRWDVNLNRLRARLTREDVRPGLLNADGTGRIELVLLPDDTIDDQT